jgi:hypothetical protein
MKDMTALETLAQEFTRLVKKLFEDSGTMFCGDDVIVTDTGLHFQETDWCLDITEEQAQEVLDRCGVLYHHAWLKFTINFRPYRVVRNEVWDMVRNDFVGDDVTFARGNQDFIRELLSKGEGIYWRMPPAYESGINQEKFRCQFFS